MKKLSLLSFLALLSSCSAINEKLGLKDDNILEETLEYSLKIKTGLDFDFTPATPE